MSLGATASAPASTWLDGGPREQLERLVVGDLAVADDAAVAVRGVLAEADVSHQHQLGVLRAERAKRLLHDPVLVPGTGALVVLLVGHAEEEERLDAKPGQLAGLGDEVVDRVTAHPGQILVPNRRGPGEERQHEVVEVEPRLAHQAPEGIGSTQPPEACRRECAHADTVRRQRRWGVAAAAVLGRARRL